MATNSAKYAGRVDPEEILLIKQNKTKVDIKNFVIEFNCSTSLLDSSATLDFYVIDGQGMLNKLPIEPGDRIRYTFTENDRLITIDSFIFRVKNIVDAEKQRAYTIQCHSELYYVSRVSRISKHYKGAFSDIALGILNEHTNEEVSSWEPAGQNRSVIVPNWNPVEAIMWLAKNSQSGSTGMRFKFFQNSKMKYNFTSLEYLAKFQEPVMSYRYNISTKAQDSGAPNSKNVYSKIMEIKYHTLFDFKELYDNGTLRGTSFVSDITKKKLDVVTYDYWRDFDEGQILNKWPLYRQNDIGVGQFIYRNRPSLSNTNIEENYIHNKSDFRTSYLKGGQTVTIVVKGNSVVDVGSVVELNIPSPEPVSSQRNKNDDELWSGLYYVAAKRDMHQQNEHVMSLTLVKDSFVAEQRV